jgi:hypothetical protein
LTRCGRSTKSKRHSSLEVFRLAMDSSSLYALVLSRVGCRTRSGNLGRIRQTW